MIDQKLHILQHSLGLNQYGEGNQYRNYFVTGPGSRDYESCCELVTEGLMKNLGSRGISGSNDIFIVTPKGIDYVALNSLPAPKLTRGQKRYRAYLSSESGETFGEWLKNSYWDDYRKRMGA